MHRYIPLAVSAVVTGLVLLLPTVTFADLAPALAPCATVGTPFLTFTQNISNDPDSGNLDNWALDTFTENISVWVGSDGVTYCANATANSGTFVTTGPQSPNTGAPMSSGITGTFTGGENYILPSTLTLNPLYSTTTVSNVTLPPNTCGSNSCASGAFSNWVADAFTNASPPYNQSVNTYWLSYQTPHNGSWIDSDPISGGNNTGDITGAPVPSVVTNDATSISGADATLNGTNGDVAADGESFWVSTATFDTSTPNIPANVYSTPVLSGVGADTAFSDPLSLVTTNGIVTGGLPGNMPAITPNTTYYYAAWSEIGGTWYPGAIKHFTTSTPPPPSSVTVTIDKFIDGKAASTTGATAVFPMQTTYSATNIGSGTNVPFSIGPTPYNSTNPYEAITSAMSPGANYSVNEVADGSVVGSCTSGAQFALAGYTTGSTYAAALAGTPTTAVPSFTNMTQNEYVIVWNTTCAPTSTLKVHILKYLNGVEATAVSANNYQFPMTATWQTANLNGGAQASGAYTLGVNYGGNSELYGADTAAMAAPASYTTSEITNDLDSTSKVLPEGATCIAGDYRLDGYQSSSVSFADAASSTVSVTAPSFTGLSTDQYVIVDNETCPSTASLTITKASIGGNGTFNFTSNIPGHTSFSITTANHTGSVTFSGIAPGPYQVTEVNMPKGWTQTDDACDATALTLAAGDDVNCVITNTNNKLLGSIRGTKYEDVDGDGSIKDGGNHRVPGVTINITGLGGYSTSTITDSHGLYDFTGLAAGTYTVTESVPTGWTQTYPANGSWKVTLSAGQNAKQKDFGDFKLGTISGMKFNDANGNGRKDKNESGIQGITINLKGPHGFSASTVTDTNGNYSFSNLGPGLYNLSEVVPKGWNQTDRPWAVRVMSGTNSKNNNFGNTQHSKNKWGGFW
jgi:hypothetical protein